MDSLGPVDSKGPQGEESASFMARIVGLLVLGLVLVMVGFAGVALFWLGIVGLVVFVATGFVAAIHPSVDPVEPPVGNDPVPLQSGRVRLGRRRPVQVRGPVTREPLVGRRGGNHRSSGSAPTTDR